MSDGGMPAPPMVGLAGVQPLALEICGWRLRGWALFSRRAGAWMVAAEGWPAVCETDPSRERAVARLRARLEPEVRHRMGQAEGAVGVGRLAGVPRPRQGDAVRAAKAEAASRPDAGEERPDGRKRVRAPTLAELRGAVARRKR